MRPTSRWHLFALMAIVFVLLTAGCQPADDGGEDRGGGSAREDQTGPSPFSQQAGAEYVGSGECAECHDGVYAQWFDTGHAQIIQDVEDNPRAIKGDFTSESTTRTFSTDDIILTHGVQWKQRYVNSKWQVLPAQWNFDSRTWAPYRVDEWEEIDWRKECAYCHTVGYDAEGNDWQELGIGCEACHGPGSAHVDNPTLGNIQSPRRMTRTVAGDLCGNCHTRGKSPDGEFEFPVGFTPGDTLKPSNFVPVSYETTKSWWPDGAVREHRQQWIQWKETTHFRRGIDCSACHTVHTQATKFGTKEAPNELCRECHSDISTDPVTGHAPIAGAPQHSNCVACHMPPTGKSADFGDERDHRFTVIQPRVTIELGDGDPEQQPNSCNLCHYHEDDDPEDLQRALDQGLQSLRQR